MQPKGLNCNATLDAKFDHNSCRLVFAGVRYLMISHTTITKRCCISLIELETPILSGLKTDQFINLQKVVTSAKALLWVTGGGGESAEMLDLNLVSGFSRCI